MNSPLANIFAELLREVEANPALRERIERHLSHAPKSAIPTTEAKRRNRRSDPAVDPYVLLQQGESSLRSALAQLDTEQLKDVISAFALDSSRLALKWKDRERLIELIVSGVRARLEKGDAFRGGSTAT
jgi:hypothetical protein